MRHLTPDQAAFALRRGRPIEQFLGRDHTDDGRAFVRWLTISPRDSAFAIVRHHVEDIGNRHFADLSEFPPVDPEEYVGEGAEVARSDQASDAIEAAAAFGARSDRWVNAGVIGDEYRDSL